MKYFITLLATLLMVITSCSQQPETTSTPLVNNTPSSTPASRSPQVGLTREGAAQRYLALVKASEPALSAYNKNMAIYDSSSFTDLNQFLSDTRKTSAALLKADKQFIVGLMATAWPAEVKADIETKAQFIQATDIALAQLARVKNFEDIDHALRNLPNVSDFEDNSNLIRAHLGLPPVD